MKFCTKAVDLREKLHNSLKCTRRAPNIGLFFYRNFVYSSVEKLFSNNYSIRMWPIRFVRNFHSRLQRILCSITSFGIQSVALRALFQSIADSTIFPPYFRYKYTHDNETVYMLIILFANASIP